ncbi:MAG: flagellar hook assembly protein FlgD [Rhodospirillaceae bacterium]|nr:flagellar hook assembly protein FlgD [Rhodospirillaceae bacterium]
MVDSVSNSKAATDAATKASQSSTKLSSDLNSFLTLLTSQLKNQDPLSPMDSTQFTNQLVQFSQVEQQININSNLSNLIGLTQQNIASNVVNYIGKTIEGPSNQAPLINGNLRASYSLESKAASVNIAVKNAAGDIVFTKNGDPESGVHEFNWDGKDSNGIQQKDGNYTLEVTALAADGSTITTSTTVFGKVTGVTSVNNVTTLLLGSIGIPVNTVLAVTDGG